MAESHRQRVLGTAGHIDHGKTALVRALTGVECDRLPEERARGITLELGFAPLDFADGTRLSVVDVPGHEGLVRTMVAGATGIDLLLLVIAADEGVMPQTREHVAIAHLLGIGAGVVALTKCDAVDEEMAALAGDEARALLSGTALSDAPVIATSATTGSGIDALRDALLDAAVRTAPRTARDGVPRLAIDRSFVAKGFGTVVTGTLVGGEIREGDKVQVLPGGAVARVRGVECHGEAIPALAPGARCALNLQGVELAQVPRGAVLVRPGAVEASAVFDARLRWLPEAPPLDGPTSLLLLCGTAECAARVAPVAAVGGEPLAPGGEGFVRVHLEQAALPLLPGDRFVLRGFARTAVGGRTLGGGEVLDAAPPRRRLSDPLLARELGRLQQADPGEALCIRIERAGLAGARRDALARQTGMEPEAVGRALAGIPTVVAVGSEGWVARSALAELAERALAALDAFHASEPLLPGMPVAALRGALPDNVPAAVAARVLEVLTDEGRIALADGIARRTEHRARLDPEDERWVAALREAARDAGLAPPTLREWTERLGLGERRVQDLLAWLERSGELVRAPGDLFFDASAVGALRERVRAHLEREGSLDTRRYKELIGTTRKHAVPLMELFDAEKLTVRRGETRRLRTAADASRAGV